MRGEVALNLTNITQTRSRQTNREEVWHIL